MLGPCAAWKVAVLQHVQVLQQREILPFLAKSVLVCVLLDPMKTNLVKLSHSKSPLLSFIGTLFSMHACALTRILC